MEKLRAAFIGTGRRWQTPGATGFGMNNEHAKGYAACAGVELAACADLKEELAKEFAEKHKVQKTYIDHRKMLQEIKPDVVSVSVWPHLHADLVVDCVQAGVRAVHCEKPMDVTWGQCRRMAGEAAAKKCRLTFNHQRRFGEPFQKAYRMIQEGGVGKIVQMDAFMGDFYDWGTHWLDMLQFFNNETPAEWVMGQFDFSVNKRVFGAPVDNMGIWQIKYKNGVLGLSATGSDKMHRGVAIRVTGTDGMIEILWEKPHVRARLKGDREMKDLPTEENLHGPGWVERAIADVVGALREGRTSILCAENALRATEIIFAGYESGRRHGRVDLPLTIDDNPIEAMIASGELKPQMPGKNLP